MYYNTVFINEKFCNEHNYERQQETKMGGSSNRRVGCVASGMAESSMAEFAFKEVEILEHDTLGRGAYGTVCKAKCDQLICAAKFLHPIFFETNDPGENDSIERFQKECNLLSQISHPNVVQYLGTHRQPGIRTVILLMELLDQSLDHYLLQHTAKPLPFHLEVQFSHDIAQALNYLHINNIHHRDLSAKNVLMLGEFRVKVSDFGMSKLCDPKAGYNSKSPCPGNILYMPPEALSVPAKLSDTLDEFSLGVVMIQIMNRKDPNPGKLQESTGEDLVYRAVPEKERRKEDIELCDQTNPLLPLALLCIEHDPKDRPLASFLSHYLSLLKTTMRYQESFKHNANTENEVDDFVVIKVDDQTQEYIDRIQSLQHQLEERDRLVTLQSQFVASRDRQLWERDQIIREKEEMLSQHEVTASELQAELQHCKEIQVSCDAQIIQYMNENELLKQRVKELEQRHGTERARRPVSTPPKLEVYDEFNNSLQWVEGQKAPMSLQPQSSSIAVCNEKIFVSHCNYNRGKGSVYQYSLGDRYWKELPIVEKSEFSLAVTGDSLLAVGGSFQLRTCSSIIGLTTSNSRMLWERRFPDMPTPRSFPSCATTSQYLVVAGGEQGGEPVPNVEILDIERNGWMCVASIPRPLCRFTKMTMSINANTIYCLGGFQQGTLSRVCLVAKINDLINHRSLRREPWRELPVPAAGAGSTVYRNRVLALGGFVDGFYSKYIHYFNGRDWIRTDSLPLSLSRCNAAVAKEPSGRDVLVVVGGSNSNGINANIFIADLVNLTFK